MYPKYYKYKLDNNMQILLVPIKNINIVATSLTFDIGYFEESKEEDGIAHFLEHMIARFITSKTKVKDIKEAGNFIYSNAHTSDFRTSYHIYSDKKYTRDLIDSLYEIYGYKNLDKKLYKKELGAVIVELKQIISDIDRYVFYKHIPEMIYGKNNKLVGDPKVTIENLKKIDENDLIKFVKKYYNSYNSIVTVIGDFDKNSVLKYLEKKSKNLQKQCSLNRQITIPIVKNPQYLFVKNSEKKIDSLYLNFKCDNSYNYKEKAITQLFIKIMTEFGDSSILFKRLRSKLGIVYSPQIFSQQYPLYGIITISFSIENQNIEKALEELINILNESKKKNLDRNLFKMSKDKSLYDIHKDMSDRDPTSFLYYTYKLLNNEELLNPLEYYNKWTKGITLNDIKNWCKKTFTKDNTYLCIIGKKEFTKSKIMKQLERL